MVAVALLTLAYLARLGGPRAFSSSQPGRWWPIYAKVCISAPPGARPNHPIIGIAKLAGAAMAPARAASSRLTIRSVISDAPRPPSRLFRLRLACLLSRVNCIVYGRKCE